MSSTVTFPRESGILLHPTSLPGPFGIGDLGPEAYRFVDFLADAGQHLWQMLPLGPVGYGSSPYQSLSAFAGNPLLISPIRLVEAGLLDGAFLGAVPDFPKDMVDFASVGSFKSRMLRSSFEVFETSGHELRERFDAFCDRNSAWLDDFSLYMAVKEAHRFTAWTGNQIVHGKMGSVSLARNALRW